MSHHFPRPLHELLIEDLLPSRQGTSHLGSVGSVKRVSGSPRGKKKLLTGYLTYKAYIAMENGPFIDDCHDDDL